MSDIPATPADGNLMIKAGLQFADVNIPKLTEAIAASGKDLSCYATALEVTLDQASITDERLCTTDVFEQPGRKTHGLSITVIDNTNSPDETEFNDAVNTLVEGTVMDILIRRGKAFDTALATGDTVRIYRVKVGAKVDLPPEANSTIKSQYKLFIISSPALDVKIVAGS